MTSAIVTLFVTLSTLLNPSASGKTNKTGVSIKTTQTVATPQTVSTFGGTTTWSENDK